MTGPSEPIDEQPAEPRRWWSVIPRHLGRARTSTVILGVLFVALFALYLNVRPDPVRTGTTGGGTEVTEPAPTTGSTTPTPSPEPTTAPAPSTVDEPTTTEETTTSVPEDTTAPPEPTDTVPPPTDETTVPLPTTSEPTG